MKYEERLKRKNEFDGELTQGARKFNIKTGRDSHLKRIEDNRKILIDPETGLIRKAFCIARPCPVCKSKQASTIFCKNGFEHVRCFSCDMVYVSPVLTDEKVYAFYQNEDSYTSVLMNDLQVTMDFKKFHYGLDLIEEIVPQKGKLLDIGCGPGAFLKVAKEREWDVRGLEFNRFCIEQLRKDNIEVVDVQLKKAGFESNSFQCITLWTVLEHVMEPDDLLSDVASILAPGGVVLILVPNVDSLANRILHERSTTFAGESHVNLFNAKSLTMLLNNNGFETRESETILTRLGTINNYLNYEDPQFGEGKKVIDILTPRYIHDNLMGYLLLTIAVKNK